MTELFTSAFITLAVIIDPPGCAPIFASLTSGTDAAHRRKMAIRSVVVAWCILIFFALLGEPLLETLGISLSAFRLAGGIMLFMIALDMVFEKRTERREERAKEIEGTPEAEDISVFPMAIPMIAGPGSIATVMLLSARAQGTLEGVVVFSAMTLVLLLTLLALLAAGPLMKLIGAKLEAMITRILGVILAALATQFVLDGLERSLPGLAAS
ncbi:MarC family protein [Sphingomonas sp. LY160]|uniref:MarC family protein n=1 Tax=Sphingomonas sp. LY160 TaxID=3095342 RepID=UPI002ADED8AC|nr:MarC family protein [Sphingomonas sp. LY160]MEA1072533.1 MarC family protein [Sphingomonas sp. LY160]